MAAKESKASKGAEGAIDAAARSTSGESPSEQAPPGQMQIDPLTLITNETHDATMAAQAARVAQLENEVGQLQAENARLVVVVASQGETIMAFETDPAPQAQQHEHPLNVIFTKEARGAERRGDHAANALLNEIAIAAGALKHKVGAARGHFKGSELNQTIESLYGAL